MYYNAFGQSPIILQSIGRLDNFSLENYDKEANEIAKKISEEQIKFDGIIPFEYLYNKNIFESIVAINPELLQEKENRLYLDKMTRGMTDEEAIEYYQKIGVPFNRETVVPNNMLSVLECLKHDHLTLAYTQKLYTKEEYKQIYDQMKENIKLEEVLENEFLTQNPYFVNDLIKSGLDLSEIDLQKTKYYEEFYLNLKATAIKSGVSIPEPKNYKDIIKFNEDGEIYIELDSVESVTKALEYIKDNELNQDLIIFMDKNNYQELIISDNIDFFEKLHENNANINFKYKYDDKAFTLESVIDSEHFMQYAADNIKSKNFSPLEQLVAIYDIAKAFKPYKEDDSVHNSAKSRALYQYLESEYMVCAGYADLVVNLSHRLGINCSKIHLDTIKGGESSGHARNYVNLVDSKYGIDGMYVLEPTWEQNGKIGQTSGRRPYEQVRSTYNHFLLTTEEGRNNYSDGSIDVKTYDNLFSCTNPEELRKATIGASFANRLDEQFKFLDPHFYETMKNLKMYKDEDANVVIEYLKAKINNPVPKEALLDAIINVKKTVYLNFNEQDFEDMRMGYSLSEPFAIKEYDSNGICASFESLYGKQQYDEYMERRYNEIKLETLESATEKNPCLNVRQIIENKKCKEIKDNKIFSNYSSGNSLLTSDSEIIELLMKNASKIEELGFQIDYADPEDDYDYLRLNFPSNQKKNGSIEEEIEFLKQNKKRLYIALGLEKEKTQTQKLGEETIEEQKDTKGKDDIQNEMSRQLEYNKEQENQIIQ